MSRLQKKPAAHKKRPSNTSKHKFFLLLWVIFALLDPDPDPMARLKTDPDPDPKPCQNVWQLSLYEHFIKVLSLYLEARIHIRIKVKGRIQIPSRIKVKCRIRIRIRVKATSRIWILNTAFIVPNRYCIA